MRLHISLKIIFTIAIYCLVLFALVLFQFGRFEGRLQTGYAFDMNVLQDNNGQILEFRATSNLFDIVIDKKNPIKLIESNAVINCEMISAEVETSNKAIIKTSNGIEVLLNITESSANLSVNYDNNAPEGDVFIILPVTFNQFNENIMTETQPVEFRKGTKAYTVSFDTSTKIMFRESGIRMKPGSNLTISIKTEEPVIVADKPAKTEKQTKLAYITGDDWDKAIKNFQTSAEQALITSRKSAYGWTDKNGNISLSDEAIRVYFSAMAQKGQSVAAAKFLKAMDTGSNGSVWSSIFSGFYIQYVSKFQNEAENYSNIIKSGDLEKILAFADSPVDIKNLFPRRPDLANLLSAFLDNQDISSFAALQQVQYFYLKSLLADDKQNVIGLAEKALQPHLASDEKGIFVSADKKPLVKATWIAACIYAQHGLDDSETGRSLAAWLIAQADESGFVMLENNDFLSPEKIIDSWGLDVLAPVIIPVSGDNGINRWIMTAMQTELTKPGLREINLLYKGAVDMTSYILLYNLPPAVLSFYNFSWPPDYQFDLYYAGYYIYSQEITVHKLELNAEQVQVYIKY